MQVLKTVAEMRTARAGLGELGLVPTMGFLHEGHLSLVSRARAENAASAATIFVNPTQFGPAEDLARYPRDLPRDLGLLEAAGVDLVFAPEPAEMYPAGFDASIQIGGVTDVLEGAVRPGHFAGVATVVAKLFNIVQPSRAYFGQKDAQQSVVIKKLVRDLDMPVEVVVAPTVREADGLALSSRNSYLTPKQRAAAPTIFRALSAAEVRYRAGERSAEVLRHEARRILETEPGFTAIDYVSVADAGTLRELETVAGPALISIAARLSGVRLIDNLPLG